MILDLFAGAGGWSEGLLDLGLSDVGVELMPEACATRQAAGHATVRADVTTMPVRRDGWDGLIASPPCQSFSMAGNRAGLDDPRGELVWQIPRYVQALRPRWVACEQVPPVLGIWEHIAHTLRCWGYSVWTGILNAADFGVPQTRKRAYLIGRADGAALPPEPTHARVPGDGLFGGSRLPWVSMAQALGWGFVRWVHERPATTVVGTFRPDIIAAPGYRTETPRQDAPGSVRVSVAEAAVLQGFRADYPWQGSRTKQYLQVGNAVCPPMAAAICGTFYGVGETT